MRVRPLPIRQVLNVLAAGVMCATLTAFPTLADVLGRLKFSVKNAADEKPLANAKIVLKDSANVRPNITLTTDAQGSAISPDLEIRAWQITTNAEKPDTFQTDTRQVTVVGSTTTDVEILLEPTKEKTIVIKSGKDVIQKGQTSDSTHRDSAFIQSIPSNAGNPQSLTQVLKSTPGLVQDSVNQAHPRGEHSSTSIYIDGFALAGVLQGRGGPIISPDVIQTLDVLTGGYAPEYGGELAAVLNINLKAGSIRPVNNLLLQGGEFGTLYGNFSASGQFGPAIGPKETAGNQARRFGYFLNVNGRSTDNALEPPQPDNQSAHNHGEAQTYFGNFTANLGSRDNLSLTVNEAPAYTQIANRTGLPDSFAPFGQGYGYAGHLSRIEAMNAGIPTQEADGQNVYQRDQNEFAALNWRHSFNRSVSGLLSVGVSHAGLDILNGNPAVDLNNLPADNSIEFNPTIRRNAHTFQAQGSLTATQGRHNFKAGILTNEQESNESYNLVPASQLAVNALAAVDPRLLPAGMPVTGANGNPVMDSLGNQVFQLDPNGVAPTVSVKHTGFYRAAYIQDTWNATRRFTANYGLRYDWYHADITLSGATNSLDTDQISPRINLAYLLTKRTIWRASYNRLFTQPPLSQAATLGLAIPPQTGDLYETSFEHQLAPNQTAKIAYYYKEWRNFADTGLLVPGTQLGVYTTFSHPHVNVNGVEFSYDLLPKNNVGWGAYVTWANAVNRLLAPESGYTDHDQLNTIGFGIEYTCKNQASAGFSLYHGSGVNSSVVDMDRTPRTVLNLRLASAPTLFGGSAANGHGGVELAIENLLDDRPVINFQSAFSGTRFQQGRRILLSAFGKF
ncbi:MAG TPA: TonB-dependent receptor [Chthonomonadaceae bacterium]|nr:TonB-dependent receptor [Chthonomonadaceae bacterium]